MIDNFIVVVGFPKCGTTALAEMLRMGLRCDYLFGVKEPNIFGSGLVKWESAARRRTDFYSINRDDRTVIDATPSYIFDPSALKEIKAVKAKKKTIIALVRDPFDFISSYHSEMIFNGNVVATNIQDHVRGKKSILQSLISCFKDIDPKIIDYEFLLDWEIHLTTARNTLQAENFHIFNIDRIPIEQIASEVMKQNFIDPAKNLKPMRLNQRFETTKSSHFIQLAKVLIIKIKERLLPNIRLGLGRKFLEIGVKRGGSREIGDETDLPQCLRKKIESARYYLKGLE